jgi:hypothetical protein
VTPEERERSTGRDVWVLKRGGGGDWERFWTVLGAYATKDAACAGAVADAAPYTLSVWERVPPGAQSDGVADEWGAATHLPPEEVDRRQRGETQDYNVARYTVRRLEGSVS